MAAHPTPTSADAPLAAPVALPPAGVPVDPCALCGYHAPGPQCPHCAHAPAEPSLVPPAPRWPAEWWTAATALLRGALFLYRTPGTVRWLVPPILLTVLAFALGTVLLTTWIDGWLSRVVPAEVELDEHLPGWLATALEWPVRQGLALLAAQAAGWLLTLAVAALVWWFAFSIVFEALAGPFLDEVHGRFEARWFGADPRTRLERPAGSDPRLNLRLGLGASAAGVLAAAGLWFTGAGLGAALLGALAPLAIGGLLWPRFGRWAWWVARLELRALRTSLLALTLSGLLLLLFLPLLFVPWIGPFLFAAAAGFATSLSLLDLPFSRRGLSLRARLSFLGQHLGAMAVHGSLCGALFSVPFLGPLVVVPAASVGGLWLFCRLDKSALRRDRRRVAVPRA
jgi:uncharacterized protein involved in cysteine biosynthesis